MAKKITFLGIETSCDETAAAVIRENDKGTADILSNIVSSQIKEHKKFGGVVPELAARAHLENIEYIIDAALEESIDFKAIKTSGDINQNVKLSEIGGKNLFCKEIEEKLLKKEIDIAVHSLKDMESVENSNLAIGAYIKRNDYRDVIISNKIKKLEDLKGKIVIGSSSKRRELQLKKINKNISVTSLRGNIDTRIKKLEEGKLDGIILAAAGVKSLNLSDKIGLSFKTEEVLPAVGQV